MEEMVLLLLLVWPRLLLLLRGWLQRLKERIIGVVALTEGGSEVEKSVEREVGKTSTSRAPSCSA